MKTIIYTRGKSFFGLIFIKCDFNSIHYYCWNKIVRDTPSRIEINKRGVQDLFSDILYQETDLQEYLDT